MKPKVAEPIVFLVVFMTVVVAVTALLIIFFGVGR
jgi:hypothetical protein